MLLDIQKLFNIIFRKEKSVRCVGTEALSAAVHTKDTSEVYDDNTRINDIISITVYKQ